jgi:hypothetical protein
VPGRDDCAQLGDRQLAGAAPGGKVIDATPLPFILESAPFGRQSSIARLTAKTSAQRRFEPTTFCMASGLMAVGKVQKSRREWLCRARQGHFWFISIRAFRQF